MHLEITARLLIDGIINKDYYVNAEFLNRGATYIREDETLPEVYVKYSDHYVNGQKITENTIDYIYSQKLHDCAKTSTYMGLWQIAQASSALNVPIQSMYQMGGDKLMRLDFHRIFFPVDPNTETSDVPIVLMWTSAVTGSTPNHFVPLLPKRNKYAEFIGSLIHCLINFSLFLF